MMKLNTNETNHFEDLTNCYLIYLKYIKLKAKQGAGSYGQGHIEGGPEHPLNFAERGNAPLYFCRNRHGPLIFAETGNLTSVWEPRFATFLLKSVCTKFEQIAKKFEQIAKNWEKIWKKEEKSGRNGKNQEGSFTLPLLTDRAGYALLAVSLTEKKVFAPPPPHLLKNPGSAPAVDSHISYHSHMNKVSYMCRQ